MVIIFRGTSGVGKSMLSKILLGLIPVWDEHPEDIAKDSEYGQYMLALRKETKNSNFKVYSADSYFTDKDGNYNFDARELSRAHGQCLKKFSKDIHMNYSLDTTEVLLVDNTNCSAVEVAPYAALATAFGHTLKIITLLHDVESCAKRNAHGVSLKTIIRQRQNLDDSLRSWPAWWPQEIFFV